MPKLQLAKYFFIVFICTATAVAIPRSAWSADEPSRVLGSEVDGVPVNQLLKNYLLEQLRPHFAARRAAIDAMDTPEKFRQRQATIRQRLQKLNGPFPDRTPLNPQVTGTIQRDGYVIENVIYESRPGYHITANFYLPTTRAGPVPGVLVPCGHSANGKASEVYQSICISLAQQGIAALIYDPIGQGERHQLLGEEGKPVVWGTTEHTLVGVGAWLVGTGTQNYRIWDGIRSIDYLTQRAEVDDTRIGCTGNSGGGTMTSYLMAFDQRILAAAPSCYLTTLERLFETIGPQDAEQNFPGQVAAGIDHADFIHLHAPQPTLMCVATQDFFDNDGAWTTFREAKQLYSMLGHSERMGIIDFDDQHGFSKPRRVAAMRFMKRWLLKEDDNPEEGTLVLSSDRELQCTKTGEVLLDFPNAVNTTAITRHRAETLAPARVQLWRDSPEQGLSEARRLSGFRKNRNAPTVLAEGSTKVASGGRSDWNGAVDRISIQATNGIPIPGLLFRPADGSAPLPPVIFASSDGIAAEFDPMGRCAQLAREGHIVLAIDVRGFGETRAGVQRQRDGYFGTDLQTALLAIHLSRPLLGQRAEDIQAATNYLLAREDVDATKLHLIGAGQCGPVAIHFAAFDGRVKTLTTINSIESWLEVLDDPFAIDQLTNVVPSALEYYDLPDLVRAREVGANR